MARAVHVSITNLLSEVDVRFLRISIPLSNGRTSQRPGPARFGHDQRPDSRSRTCDRMCTFAKFHSDDRNDLAWGLTFMDC